MKGTINVEPISSKDSSDEDDDDGHTQFSENSPIGKYTPSSTHNHHHPQYQQRDRTTDNTTTTSTGNGTYGYQRKQSITPQSTTSSSAPSYYQHGNKGGLGKQEGESLDSLMADLGNMVHSRSQESDGNGNTAYAKVTQQLKNMKNLFGYEHRDGNRN
jgi:hypothetical protein